MLRFESIQAIVELQAMLEGALLGPEGDEWKKEPQKLPEAYEQWVDAQLFSKEAADRWLTFADTIFPLDKTAKKPVLDAMWSKIKQVCVTLVSTYALHS